MATYIRITSVLASVFILTACSSTAQGVKPKVEAIGGAAPNSACLTQTGSHIAGSGTTCSSLGSSYSSSDIGRTGATTPAEALRLMDPSITTNQH
jgi:hypothetical protein